MTPQETSKRKIWLRRAGFITGIAGIIEIFVYTVFAGEGGPGWWALPPAFVFTLIFSIPIITCLVISRTRSLLGGILLTVISVVIMVVVIVQFVGRPSVNLVA